MIKPYEAKLTRKRHTLRNISILKNVAYIVTMTILLMFLFCGIWFISARNSGKSFTIIASNSMTPTYQVMDTVVYSPKQGDMPYKPGDNIVFIKYDSQGNSEQVFHKIIRISDKYDRFYTRGIANNSEDDGFRHISDILGSEDYHIKSKFVSLFILAMNRINAHVMVFIILCLIIVMGLFLIIKVLSSPFSRTEDAYFDSKSMERFESLLREYNSTSNEKESIKILKKILSIDTSLKNVSSGIAVNDCLISTNVATDIESTSGKPCKEKDKEEVKQTKQTGRPKGLLTDEERAAKEKRLAELLAKVNAKK